MNEPEQQQQKNVVQNGTERRQGLLSLVIRYHYLSVSDLIPGHFCPFIFWKAKASSTNQQNKTKKKTNG